MRVSVLLLTAVLVTGCAAPPSNGGLWAQQGLDQELALFRQSEQARLVGARAVELGLADDMLEDERTRLHAELMVCPGTSREPMRLSSANRVRDEIRVRVADDQARLTETARLALADWRLRRARVNRNPEWCEAARAAMAGPPEVAPSVSTSSAAARSIAEYALGQADANRAVAPLSRYLLVVYGGAAFEPATDLELVDRLATANPEYEPDALWLSTRP